MNVMILGLKFRFNGLTQRLEMIEVLYKENVGRSIRLKLKKLDLNYTKARGLLIYEFISNLMGKPIEPFSFINDNQHILLRYEGICFIFENVSGDKNIKLFYMNKCKLYKIAIYTEPTLQSSLQILNVLQPIITVTINQGIQLANFSIIFGDKLDHVLSIMSNPQKITYRSFEESCDKGMSYKWNKGQDMILHYFSYGLDILINGDTYQVVEFVLYTNYSLHPLFNCYDRCFFTVLNPQILFLSFNQLLENNSKVKELEESTKKFMKQFDDLNMKHGSINEDDKVTSGEDCKNEEVSDHMKEYKGLDEKLFGSEYINACSSWKCIKRILKEKEFEDSISYKRNWGDDAVETIYYARRGAIFEVTDKGYLCSVTLFCSE